MDMSSFAGLRRLAVLSLLPILLTAGCRPSLDSSDHNERLKAVQNTSDQGVLAGVAANDLHKQVALAAVDKLEDQALLIQLAREEERIPEVAEHAVYKLDQTGLVEVALSERGTPGVREAHRLVESRVTSEALLCRLATEAPSKWVRRDAVRRLADQELLAQVALGDPDSMVRAAAIAKLTDPAVVTTVAVREDDEGTFGVAYHMLGELGAMPPPGAGPDVQRALAALRMASAACEPLPEAHRPRFAVVVARIALALAEPAVYDEYGEVSSIETRWNPQQQAYVGSPVQGECFWISIEMSRRQTHLSEVWCSDFPDYISASANWVSAEVSAAEFLVNACDRLSPSALARAMESPRSLLRQAAVSTIDDQSVICRTAEADGNMDVRLAALGKVVDQAVITRIAEGDSSDYVRLRAVEHLSDQRALARIATSDPDSDTRRQAIGKLTDRAVLKEIASNDPDELNRDHAAHVLTKLDE